MHVRMWQAITARKSTPEHDAVNATSSVYVSTPGVHQVSRRRPASVQLVDEYEEIPADLLSPPASPRRAASCDDIRHRPQPPIPDAGQGQRSPEVSDDRRRVASMMRKPSYKDNDVILIDSAIYGWTHDHC